jgi:type II secretory pathway component PulF
LSLKLFGKFKNKIQWKYICSEIATPINDGIQLQEILKNIEAFSGYDAIKYDVINALKTAMENR